MSTTMLPDLIQHLDWTNSLFVVLWCRRSRLWRKRRISSAQLKRKPKEKKEIKCSVILLHVLFLFFLCSCVRVKECLEAVEAVEAVNTFSSKKWLEFRENTGSTGQV